MGKLRVHSFAVSLDGFGAGPDQSNNNPLGVGGTRLHEWTAATRTWRRGQGIDGGESGSIDDEFIAKGEENIGATIMGRNMFGPVRGSWPDEEWKGWWGNTPPYHHPVFVLTHHEREAFEMDGGTTFHFVTDGIESARDQALAAADGQDVRVGGGVHTIQQYMRAGLVEEVHLAIVPILLGSGERLFSDLDAPVLGYEVIEHVASPTVTHVRLARS
jgi:dihydrofolate reductase